MAHETFWSTFSDMILLVLYWEERRVGTEAEKRVGTWEVPAQLGSGLEQTSQSVSWDWAGRQGFGGGGLVWMEICAIWPELQGLASGSHSPKHFQMDLFIISKSEEALSCFSSLPSPFLEQCLAASFHSGNQQETGICCPAQPQSSHNNHNLGSWSLPFS